MLDQSLFLFVDMFWFSKNKTNGIGDTIKQGSGRPQMSQLEENIDLAENLILNHESEPGTYLSLKEIEMETRIPQESVRQIAKFDLGLTPFKLANVQHLTREDKKKH